MSRYYRAISFIFLIGFSTGARTLAQNSKTQPINTFLAEAHQSGLFNGNLLVSENGKIVLKKSIGYADALKMIPLTTEHRFHIGSIAKEFDAVGLMMLQEQGKLNINQKVADFFPELPLWAKKISIKNLLQYTSGLPEVKFKTVHSDADNWKDLLSLEKLDFEPGSTYAYNNNNTFLRRRIIEKVTKISFNEFVQQCLLKVVGIKSGIVDPAETDPLIARSFNNDFKQDGLAVPISGWTCLTIDDFYKWSQSINSFRLINPKSTAQILVPFAVDKQSGLGGGKMKGNKIIEHIHDGSALHYQALLFYDDTKDRTILILSNQRQGNVYEIAAAIQAILDNKPFQALTKPGSK